MVDRISVASNNKLQIEEREKYENKAEKSTWLVEDAWDHATAPPRLQSLICARNNQFRGLKEHFGELSSLSHNMARNKNHLCVSKHLKGQL